MEKRTLNISPRFWVLLIVVTIVLLAITISSHLSAIRAQTATIASLEAELSAEQIIVADLRRKIDFTQTDAYKEQAARRYLDMAYPDEIRFVDSTYNNE